MPLEEGQSLCRSNWCLRAENEEQSNLGMTARSFLNIMVAVPVDRPLFPVPSLPRCLRFRPLYMLQDPQM